MLPLPSKQTGTWSVSLLAVTTDKQSRTRKCRAICLFPVQAVWQSRQATGPESDRPARHAVPTAMARPFSSPHIPSSSWVTRRPPPWTSSPSVSTTRTSASSITACRPRRRAVAPAASLHLGPGEIAELARNKVSCYPAARYPSNRIFSFLFVFRFLNVGLVFSEGFDCGDSGERDRAAVQALHLGQEWGRRRRP